MFKAHLEWRIRYKLEGIVDEDFSDLKAHNELYWGGYDKDGVMTLMWQLRKHDAKRTDAKRFVRFFVHQIEAGLRTCYSYPNGQFNILVDLDKVVRSLTHKRLLRACVCLFVCVCPRACVCACACAWNVCMCVFMFVYIRGHVQGSHIHAQQSQINSWISSAAQQLRNGVLRALGQSDGAACVLRVSTCCVLAAGVCEHGSGDGHHLAGGAREELPESPEGSVRVPHQLVGSGICSPCTHAGTRQRSVACLMLLCCYCYCGFGVSGV